MTVTEAKNIMMVLEKAGYGNYSIHGDKSALEEITVEMPVLEIVNMLEFCDEDYQPLED